MKRLSIIIILIVSGIFYSFRTVDTDHTNLLPEKQSINLKIEPNNVNPKALEYGILGFEKLLKQAQLKNDSILTIVDFSQPSTEKRLYILNIKTGKVIKNTYVAHGTNSGELYATDFSNTPNSHQSSLGFYITMHTYSGKHGYSLRLEGVENGLNDKALERAIVMHGANYVSENFIKKTGRLGRSFGCPAVPLEYNKQIIDLIKDQSCIFLYHPSYEKHLASSNFALLK